MASKDFRDLRVYLLAEELANSIWDQVVQWDHFAKDTVGKQLVRAADSIGANIAEGAGRASFQDNRRFVSYARGSLRETQHFLRVSHKRGLLSEESISVLKAIMDELPAKLGAYLKSIGNSNS